ncbi:MAG: glycine zipper 2TM domain-containing protein [Rhodoferax sp.]|nr:glycine zipper 2TM domain-containing protein [Rhodoferax sp.]
MKKIVITSLLASALIGAHAQSYTDNARVRSAEPVLENISVPREECSNHWVQEPMRRSGSDRGERRDRNYGGAIVGGLAGGVVGHQFGQGSGKDAATALGVVLGAMVGDQHQNRAGGERFDERPVEVAQRQVRSCRTVYDSQSRITGYRVAYEYRGQQYTTVTRNHPGNQLLVRISVDPIEQ